MTHLNLCGPQVARVGGRWFGMPGGERRGARARVQRGREMPGRLRRQLERVLGVHRGLPELGEPGRRLGAGGLRFSLPHVRPRHSFSDRPSTRPPTPFAVTSAPSQVLNHHGGRARWGGLHRAVGAPGGRRNGRRKRVQRSAVQPAADRLRGRVECIWRVLDGLRRGAADPLVQRDDGCAVRRGPISRGRVCH